MKLPIIVFILLSSLLAACSSSEDPRQSAYNDEALTAEAAQNETNKYLAYEHHITVDTPEENLEPSYNEVIKSCIKDKVNICTILDSNLSTGRHVAANIRIRIKPQGVKLIIDVAAKNGEISDQSTHVEDLAKPIVDSDERLKMLQTYRARLFELEKKAANDIDALIKISSELSKVQSDLEQVKGNNAHLLMRTNMDILNISFVVNKNRSFWSPISRSLSSFGRNLSNGVSRAITGIAYLLPWLVIIVSIIFFFRFLWRRGKKA